MKMTNFRWKVAWLIFAISFVSYMDRVNLSVATPVIMKEFGFTKIDMGLIQSFFFAGYALMQVPGGMLAEKFGHRFTGSIACGWWSVFTALTAVASGKYTFAIVRLMFGLGEAPIILRSLWRNTNGLIKTKGQGKLLYSQRLLLWSCSRSCCCSMADDYLWLASCIPQFRCSWSALGLGLA